MTEKPSTATSFEKWRGVKPFDEEELAYWERAFAWPDEHPDIAVVPAQRMIATIRLLQAALAARPSMTDDLRAQLPAQLYHAGWIQSGTRRWHFFAPGMSISECGLMRASNDAPRHPEIGSEGCANCRKVIARFAMKLRDAGWDVDKDIR